MPNMKALTLWQPWASMVVFGKKRLENRPWFPPKSLIGSRFAIHAGKHYDKNVPEQYLAEVEAMKHCDRIHGAIIGTAVLDFAISDPSGLSPELRRYWAGPVGWILFDVQPIVPIDCRGYQKLWTVPPNIRKEIDTGDFE